MKKEILKKRVFPFFYAFETNGNLNQVEQFLDLEILNQNNNTMSNATSLNI